MSAEVPTQCARCGGQGIEIEMYSTTGWTFGYDVNNREIEVEVEMPAQRQVACKAPGCWQGRVYPLGWNGELDHAFNTGGIEAVREVLAAQQEERTNG